MYTKSFGAFVVYNFALAALAMLAYAAFGWLGVPAGSLIDWAVGVASFWWLLLIVTVPWNVHFQARETLAEAELSEQKSIAVEPRQLAYVRGVARKSLAAAVALHACSAAGLYALAASGLSPVGYVSSGAALLLTGLRPSSRAYEYLRERLASIRSQLLHPREDVYELRARVVVLEQQAERLGHDIDPAREDSWAWRQARAAEKTRHELARLAAAHEELRAANKADHERLSRATEHAVAQLAADSQFLDRVREIIRFFKTA